MTPIVDLICFSHLRWDFVYQRPQHLLSRFADPLLAAGVEPAGLRLGRVFFVEEPLADEHADTPRLELSARSPRMIVVVPRVPAALLDEPLEAEAAQRELVDQLFEQAQIRDFILWYYTPVALGFTRHLPTPLATIYDCMDELSAFRGAPPELLLREAELFLRADLVFTGGQSLYEAKRRHHPAVHAFPSSVDRAHFGRARAAQQDPADQVDIGRPRLGFFGVLDERLDVELLAGVADLRSEWHLVLVGPTVKIDAATLPRRPNIWYLGSKSYAELPRYVSGWDVAMIPFARNEATRFISPTKTPEYLAAGRPVVSTSIRDVVQPYGAAGMVRIADEPQAFVEAVEAAMRDDPAERLARSDQFLSNTSWDTTWARMHELLQSTVTRRLVGSTTARSSAAARRGDGQRVAV